MTLLNIPTKPRKQTPKCLVCAWVTELTSEEQTHFTELVNNYPVSVLHRELTQIGATFSESTLRAHVTQNH